MQRFYHNELNALDTLMQALSRVLEKYNSRDLDLLPALEAWLNKAVDIFNKLGKTDRENMVLAWKAELVTAQRGVHPLTLEKVSQHRHQMQTNIAFRILQTAAAQLQSDRQACRTRLEEAGELAGQLLVAGIQAGIVSEDLLSELEGQDELEALWKALATDAHIALGQKKLLLQVSRFDVWLLLESAAAAMAEPA